MDWIRVSIHCPQESIERVCAWLSGMGAPEQEIVDDISEIHDHLQKTTQYWDYIDESELHSSHEKTCVRIYVSSDEGGKLKLARIKEGITLLQEMLYEDVDSSQAKLSLQTDIIREEDWAHNWRQFYKPMEIGKRLLVVPDWDSVPEQERVQLRLEPGLVFGTGEHQTTQLCLELLERYVKPSDTILDIGCGSGILSIAAILLGAEHAIAVDMDSNAEGIARENAHKNGIEAERYNVLCGDVLNDQGIRSQLDGSYDIIVANIVADVIITLLPYALKWIKPGGLFICSGIISERLLDVQRALRENRLYARDSCQRDDWHALCVEHI